MVRAGEIRKLRFWRIQYSTRRKKDQNQDAKNRARDMERRLIEGQRTQHKRAKGEINGDGGASAVTQHGGVGVLEEKN